MDIFARPEAGACRRDDAQQSGPSERGTTDRRGPQTVGVHRPSGSTDRRGPQTVGVHRPSCSGEFQLSPSGFCHREEGEKKA
ncbi:hypothetical protein F2P81_017504 [Scophthalmus maximus]|uniref:Uncharacterized protein n=1 Tax=Scophthalmus maximus TaxID=52904 RepID=A0A6A4S907_SCOMX|nr:hypothetical protein F2P81_017504 [Scophthalmus maximus]